MQGKIIAIVIAICLVVSIGMSRQLFQNVGSNEICVFQDAIDGELHVYVKPGVKPQMFGSVTCYPRRSPYMIQKEVQFNEGGHGTVAGSIQWDMPLDTEHVLALHQQFGSFEAIQNQLVRPVVEKVVYMTGPFMTSKESYAEKRNLFIQLVDDQIKDGVYRTTQKEEHIQDELTQEWKTVILVDLVRDKEGQPIRAEKPALTQYGIGTFNFSITNIDYDQRVKEQIAKQQDLTMQVQTAMAQSRKAEQQKLTAENEGKAEAMKAKWDQETVKATAVTSAEKDKAVAELQANQKLEVARIALLEADLYKKAKDLQAAADSNYRMKMIEADGALPAKLQTFEKVQAMWAQAIAQHQGALVPGVIFGGEAKSSNASNTTSELVSMLTAQAAKSLALDLTVK